MKEMTLLTINAISGHEPPYRCNNVYIHALLLILLYYRLKLHVIAFLHYFTLLITHLCIHLTKLTIKQASQFHKMNLKEYPCLRDYGLEAHCDSENRYQLP